MEMRERALDEVIAAIDVASPRCGAVTVVAIDGGAASGKTTLAASLAARLDGSAVVHTDDLLEGWHDQFTFWPRLRTTVLEPLSQGRAARYPHYDWLAGRFATEPVEQPPPKQLIVEGVSAIEACAAWLSLGVLLEQPRGQRERRWAERDGGLPAPAARWLDAEDAYFAGAPDGPRYTSPAPIIRLG